MFYTEKLLQLNKKEKNQDTDVWNNLKVAGRPVEFIWKILSSAGGGNFVDIKD